MLTQPQFHTVHPIMFKKLRSLLLSSFVHHDIGWRVFTANAGDQDIYHICHSSCLWVLCIQNDPRLIVKLLN